MDRARHRLAEGPREAEGELLERELLADVEVQPAARLLDELLAGAQPLGPPALGVLGERRAAVGVVDELRNAGGDAGHVAQPEADQLEPVVERGLPRAALGALGPLGALPLDAPLVLLGNELAILGHPLLHRVARVLGDVARALEEDEPRPVRELAAQGAAREALGARPQRGAVAQRARGGAVGVAETQPRARGGLLGRDAPAGEPLGDRVGIGRVEPDALAARGDRRQHLPGAVGEQDEVRVRRRLLERLEHPVGGLVVERVRRVDDEDPPARFERGPRRRVDHRLLDVAAQQAGGADRGDPGEVRVGAAAGPRERRACVGGAVGQQGGRELARDLVLAAARGPLEQVGVGRLAVRRQRPTEHRPGVRMVLDACQPGHGV